MTQKELLKHIKPKIFNTQSQKLKKKKISEIRQALQGMENGKSPGVDGIPVELYKDLTF